MAAAVHGLRTLRAATARDNAASQKVLTKTGFVPASAGPAALGGKQGTWYQRDLAAGDPDQPLATCSRSTQAGPAGCLADPTSRTCTTSGRQPKTGQITIYGWSTSEARATMAVGEPTAER